MNIVFDLDDTIYDLMEPFEKVHIELYADKTDVSCDDLFQASRVYSDEAYYMEEKGLITKEEEFAYRIKKTYADAGIEVSDEEAKYFEKRYRYHQKHIHIPEQMKEILSYCKEKDIPMAILTNGKRKNQQGKINSLKLDQWFLPEEMFISGDIGFSKPDKRTFESVERAMHIVARDTWFIGDTFEVDVDGAQNANWHVIWYNHRHRKQPDRQYAPDIEVHSVEDLFQEIKHLVEGESYEKNRNRIG